MKKLLIVALLSLSCASARADFAINLGASMLYTSNGTIPAPVGSLVQLLASTTDNLFSPVIAGSFTGGSADDIVLASFSINSGPGSVAQPITVSFSINVNLTVGDFLLLRWYPTLPAGTVSPPEGAPYGQFRIDVIENFSTIAWVVPADGSLNTLNFLTISAGGTQPESAGIANLTVLPIPEPSTVALLGFSLVGLAAYSRRRKV